MNRLDKQYVELLADIVRNGANKGDRTGTGTVSVFGREIRHNMSDGFPLLTTKKMAWKSIVVELLWFLRGDSNIQYLVQNNCNIWNGDAYKHYVTSMKGNPENEILDMEGFVERIKTHDEFAKKWGELGPVYGKQWRRWTGRNGEVDQIQNLIDSLLKNPDSRRLMVTAWNPDEVEDMVLPPCHYGFQCYTRELTHKERCRVAGGRDDENRTIGYDEWMNEQGIPKRMLSLKWNQRSVDTPLGLPFNIASYGLLLLILCKLTNMVPGELIGSLGDTHIYNNQLDGVEIQKTRKFHDLPTVEINPWIGLGVNILDVKASDIRLVGYVSEDKIDFPLSN